MLTLLTAAQVVVTTPAEPASIFPNSAAAADRCAAPSPGGEIVVCGRRDQPYRLHPNIGPDFTEKPPEAKFKLSEKTELSLHGDSGLFGSPRAMVTFKLHF
jgi:hypothetical protein